MGRTRAGFDAVESIVAEQQDFLPQLALFPALSDEDVKRFVALGERGLSRQREGEPEQAEAAFRAQAAIYAPNPGPYVSLAMLAASRGDDKAALEHIHAAVVRGFSDLGAVGRSEVWSRLRNAPRFLILQDALPKLLDDERAWAGWGAFYTDRSPADAASVGRALGEKHAALERMAPALGERPLRLWNRLIDRSAAALFEAYATQHAEATDVGDALDRLLALYAGDSTRSWQRLPAETATRLGTIASLVLERFPSQERRAGGLLFRALSLWAVRDARGALAAGTLDAIRVSLDEVLDRFADSPFADTAAEGRVRVELDAGYPGRAAAVYRALPARLAATPALPGKVRDALGVLALTLGGVPEFRAQALDGTVVDRAALAGKIVVWDFWATWCQPCREQFPTLQRLDEKFGGDVALIGVSLDHADEMSDEQLGEWIEREKLPGRQIHDGLGWDSEIVRAFGVREIPFTVIADANGEVLAIGAQGKQLLRAVEAARE